MQTLQVYIINKHHYGNELYAIRLIYGDRTKNVLLATGEPKAFDDIYLLFDVVAYMYKHNMQRYPVAIKTNKIMTYKSFKCLSRWQKNKWNLSPYTTTEMYQKGITQLDKVPKNYTAIIPTLKRIYKAQTFFKAGIDILYIHNSVRNNQYQILKNFIISQSERLPPTKAFHAANVRKLKQSTPKHVMCKFTINIDSALKDKFIQTLQDNNELSSKVLSKAIAEYIVQKGRR